MPRNIVFTATAGQSSVRWGNTPTTPTLPSLELEGPDAGTVDTAISGGRIINNGASSALFILSSTPSATITPSSGTVPAGGSVDYTFTPSTAIEHTITLTNVSGGSVTGSPALFTPDAAAPSVGTTVATLKAYAATTGTSLPFSATVLPLEGDVPAGYTLESPDDATLKATVLSTHSDGSAAVVVVSGHTDGTAGSTGTIRLQTATAGSSTALTAAAISALLTNITVSFGSYGTTVLTDFSTPTKTWWANARTICARYVIDPPSPGSTALQAVVDVQAFNGRAFVEVVIENAKVDTALTTVLAAAAANYTGATVSINGGAAIAVVNSSGVPVEGAHSWSRAWYASGWVGGNPGLRVHQSVSELQQHPLLFEMDQANTADLSGYAADAYTAWDYGRKPDANMGGVGDVDAIGPLSKWQAQWLQSGSAAAANAVEVQGLLTLHWNINTRDVTTGRVPTHTQINLKSINGNGTWPNQSNGSTALCWELMHHPAEGLAAFLVRPSPVFIEIAQKIAVWNAMWPTNFENSTVQPTGVFRGGGCTTRGRAWALRSLAHAIFLTPDGDAWKAPAKASLTANITYFDGYRTSSDAKLNICWEGDPALPQDVPYGSTVAAGPVFSTRGWFSHYLITEVHKLASARLLTGADQTAAETLADWLSEFPIRWINEQTDGGWRYIPYTTAIGRNATTIDSPATWATMRDYTHSDSPPAISGTWYFSTGDPIDYATGYGNSDTNRPRYVDYFWAALVAAVERGVPGSASAWASVQANVTNLNTWRAGFGTEPRWGSAPRQIAESYGLISTAVAAMSAGSWSNWTSSTNAVSITDTSGPDATAVGWLEGDNTGRIFTNWPGNATWDVVRKRVLLVGCTNGYSSESPAGGHSAMVELDVSTGSFTKTWNPYSVNIGHQYDGNSSIVLGGYLYRCSFADTALRRMNLVTGAWETVVDWSISPISISSGQCNALAIHPNMGTAGSVLMFGPGGRVGRWDVGTSAASLICASQTGVGGAGSESGVAEYHEGIDSIVFGGGQGGTRLYTINASGTVALLTSTFATGVAEISPRDVVSTTLAPDPQGRAYAWLFDKLQTGKVWRLNLSTAAWTDMGSIPAAIIGATCYATLPQLGVHVALDSFGRVNSSTADARVYLYKPS